MNSLEGVTRVQYQHDHFSFHNRLGEPGSAWTIGQEGPYSIRNSQSLVRTKGISPKPSNLTKCWEGGGFLKSNIFHRCLSITLWFENEKPPLLPKPIQVCPRI